MTATSSATGRAADGTDRLPPIRPAYDAHTWKEILYLLLNLPVTVFGFVYAITALSVGGALSITVIGLPLLALGLLGARQLGKLERSRARRLLGVRVEEPTPMPLARSGGLTQRWWMALKDPVGWRTLLYDAIRLPWGVLTFCTVLTSLFVLWPVLPYLARGLANVDRLMVRGLLSPSDELERRIAELESDRGVVVDTAAADLRRIERDLHDGAQARLVNLAMGLGLAKEKLLEDPDSAAAMVAEAHGEVKLALQELRDLARGIHRAGHRGHRLLHRLRAAAEHQQAQRGPVRVGGRVADAGPAAHPGPGRWPGRRPAGRRHRDAGPRGAAGRGGRPVRARLPGRRPDGDHSRAAVAGPDGVAGGSPRGARVCGPLGRREPREHSRRTRSRTTAEPPTAIPPDGTESRPHRTAQLTAPHN